VASFFVVLQFFTEVSVATLLWTPLPAIIYGIIGGSIGGLIAVHRRPDERANLILKYSARNSFLFAVLTLPYLAIVFMFMPTWSAMLCALCLLAFWFLMLAIFYLSVIYYYWK